MDLDFATFRTLRSLRHRNFRLLLLGALLSNTGDFMQDIAQSWLVWQLTHSAFLLGVVGFFDSFPRLLLGAFGGVIADRVDRRRLVIVTQALAMAQAFIYWFLVYFRLIAFWHIVLLALCLGLVNTINQTARQSLVNGLVPKEDLFNAIGLHSSVFNLSRVLGPSVGGMIIALVGISGCFLVNGLSFIAIIWTLVIMVLPPWEGTSQKVDLWNEIREGFRYVRGNRRILSVLSLSYIVSLLGAPYSRFLAVFATNILRVGPTGYGVLMAAPGIGAITSSLCLASLGDARPSVLLISSFVLGFAFFLGAFAFSHSFVLSLILLVLVGACFIAFRASANTVIQTDTPGPLLGRVLSLFFMDRGLWSFGGIVIGSAAAVITVSWAFAACALCCGVMASLILFLNRGR